MNRELKKIIKKVDLRKWEHILAILMLLMAIGLLVKYFLILILIGGAIWLLSNRGRKSEKG